MIKGRNIGKALGLIAHAEMVEAHMHEDVRAWGAPSECHKDVSRGEAERMRHIRRQVKAITGLKWSAFCKEVMKRSPKGALYLYQPSALLRPTEVNQKRYPFIFGGY